MTGINGKRWLTIDDLRAIEGGYFKFVKVDGHFRFVKVDCGVGQHTDVVDESEYDKVQAAGGLFLFPKHWRIEGRYSTTLITDLKERATIGEKDEMELAGLLAPREHRE